MNLMNTRGSNLLPFSRKLGARFAPAVLVTCALLLATPAKPAGEWPQFRGPDGQGHFNGKLPLTWSEQQNVRWKTAIHGKAWSSPVIWGNQIWLTTAAPNGRELSVVCVDRDSGKITRDQKLFEIPNPPFCHDFNSYASPTPVIEEGRLYVTFGSLGTACLDTTSGAVLWERRDFVCNHYRGAGSSPIVHENLLIMNFDGVDRQYVVALDKKTGKTVWQTDRSIDFKDLGPDGKPFTEGDLRKGFATPHIATVDGKPLLVSLGAKAAYGYEPLTGKELWRVEERTSHSSSSRPVAGHGLIFCATGWSVGQVLALRPGQPGEVIDANKPETNSATRLKVVWQLKRNVPRKPSLLLHDDLVFMIDDGGVASCVEALTGKEVWRERVGGNYSAAPIAANGRFYVFSEEGKATVLELSRTFKKLAENKLPDGFMASPAAAGQALYLRTRTHLYRIEETQ